MTANLLYAGAFEGNLMSAIHPSERLIELGIVLPPPPTPAGNYVHAVRAGNLLFLAGKADGPYVGKVGLDVSVAEAYAYARQTGIQLLGVIAHELGSIDRVTQIVKVFGLVNATSDFADHPTVMNGCSDLMLEVFGECGRHARTSVGAASLPGNVPVEIDMVVSFE